MASWKITIVNKTSSFMAVFATSCVSFLGCITGHFDSLSITSLPPAKKTPWLHTVTYALMILQELFHREEVTEGEVEDLERFFVEINPSGPLGCGAWKCLEVFFWLSGVSSEKKTVLVGLGG